MKRNEFLNLVMFLFFSNHSQFLRVYIFYDWFCFSLKVLYAYGLQMKTNKLFHHFVLKQKENKFEGFEGKRRLKKKKWKKIKYSKIWFVFLTLTKI